MWKKKLTSLTPFSTNLLRRNHITPPCTAAAFQIVPKQTPLLEFASPIFSSRKIQDQECPFSSNFYSSRAFQIPRLHFSPPTQTTNLFRFVSTSTSPAASVRCWNCDAIPANTTPFLACQSCRSVQPVDPSIDFFQILGVEKRYDIKVEVLEGKYKDWQKKLHPDLVHTKSQKERGYAAEQSARVNDAYRTLTDPLSRAVYILKLEGTEVDEDAMISDLDLLSEIMEIREAIEEATDAQALNHILAQIQEKFEYWSKVVADALEKRINGEAVGSIQRMTYYKRAEEEIIKKL